MKQIKKKELGQNLKTNARERKKWRKKKEFGQNYQTNARERKKQIKKKAQIN